MHWAQGLERVFQIDGETRPNCGGVVNVIASIEDQPSIVLIG
jgi:hypothetical protein